MLPRGSHKTRSFEIPSPCSTSQAPELCLRDSILAVPLECPRSKRKLRYLHDSLAVEQPSDKIMVVKLSNVSRKLAYKSHRKIEAGG